jgi:hypothetical protein
VWAEARIIERKIPHDIESPVCLKGKEDEDVLIIFYNGKVQSGAAQN